jgi:anaerobic ribonucleoside-triphosphate reductase
MSFDNSFITASKHFANTEDTISYIQKMRKPNGATQEKIRKLELRKEFINNIIASLEEAIERKQGADAVSKLQRKILRDNIAYNKMLYSQVEGKIMDTFRGI